MANPDHLSVLRQGAKAWNQWHAEHPAIPPDLSRADLSRADLSRADLIRANLREANLGGADLSGANLCQATLSWAHFLEANLRGANLSRAHLYQANLSQAHLNQADLLEAYVVDANLSRANLSGANLHGADLSGANLTGANLMYADLTGANLRDADLHGATVGRTAFANIDLSVAKGLESMDHKGPSTIGIDTIYKSRGNISEAFLRGAGVPDNFIAYIASLVGKPIEFYSCFISYSTKDQRFAERLFNDLQDNGVRCWFAPEHLKIGAKTRPTIDETIGLHDKLLLVLSKHSVESDWVEQEVETALARERRDKKIVLFPIRLDKSVTADQSGWPALIWNTRNVGDFTRWKNDDAYRKAFERLLRDLKAEPQKP